MDTTNRNTALASAFVDELARCGVRAATVSPGSRSTPLALAAWLHPAIAVRVLIDERTAGFHALGHALGTGLPALSIVTSGSAAANLHPAVVEADEARVPLIVATADRPPELRSIGAGQTIDQLHLYGTAPRMFVEVGEQHADRDGLLFLRGLACRAFSAASGDQVPGPVHLNFPFREPLSPVASEDAPIDTDDALALHGRSASRPMVSVGAPVRRIDQASRQLLVEQLSEAQRPMLVAGRDPHFHGCNEVADFASAWGMPVLADATSQLRWGAHDTSHVITAYDLILREAPDGLMPDLVLRIGDMPTSKALRNLLAETEGPEQIVIAPRGGWNEPTRTAETILRCDEVPLLEEVRPNDVTRAEPGWCDRWRAAESEALRVTASLIGGTLTEPGVWPALAAVLSEKDIVLAASSMPIRDMESFMPTGEHEVRFLSNRGANGIDGQVSTAAGVCESLNTRTLLVLGDLALAHDLGGLALMDDAPLLQLVVVDNEGGGIFELLPQATDMDAIDFEAILAAPGRLRPEAAAAAFGLSCKVVTTPGELAAAVEDGTRMIVVRTNRKDNAQLHGRISTEVGEAVAPVAADPS